jgi:hypothetical protein
MRLFPVIVVCLLLACSKKVSEKVQVDLPTTPPPKPATPTLHTDEEVRKLIEKARYELNPNCFVLFDVNTCQSVALSQVFKDLNIDESRIEYKCWMIFNYALIYQWKISQSYSLGCSTSWLTDISKNPPFDWSDKPPSAEFRIAEVRISRLTDELPATQP